jgi:hypothetical protein
MEYDLKIIDDAISPELRAEVWTYLLNSRWCASWKPVGMFKYGTYTPAQQGDYAHFLYQSRPNFATFQHRAAFASDEASLAQHPVINRLWQAINAQFDNQFEIAGHPEEMPVPPNEPSWEPPATQDPTLMQGWRVYANAQFDESQKRTHGVHRDSIFVDDDKNFTILYFANPVWYPSWFGDCVYYPDDPEGTTGDHQQIQNQGGNTGGNQNRNFNINWPTHIVSPRPGRIVAYDGRWLHTTHPTAVWCPTPRRAVAFRVRKR